MTRRSPAKTADIQRAVNLRASGLSVVEIGRQMNVAHQTVGGWLAPGGRAERENITPAGVADEQEALRAALEQEVRDLRAQVSAIHRENLSAKQIREMIVQVGDALPEPPDWITRPGKKGGPGVPVTLWSDWHVGEVVSKEQTGGVNTFDIATAQNRVRVLVDKIIDLCFNHQTNPDYPGIVVCLGGDMISGLIHQELVETMESPFTGQLLETFALLAWGLEALADKFGKVFVPCVVGNHGRIWHKPRAKNKAQDSFEYLLYNFLEGRFKYDKRFRFLIPDQTDALFTVQGHRFLLTHGDSTGARGGDGIIGAIGPIVRGEKRVRDSASVMDQHYDTMLMGHWHQAILLDHVIVNGCLKGYDEYARNLLRARPETPSQWLLFVHQEYGIVDARRVYLEKKLARQKKAPWVEWTEAA